MIVAGDRAREALRAAGDRPLLFSVDGPARTGSELDRRIDGVAGALVAAGAREAPVGIWMWNSAAAFEAHLAIERVGATRVPVDPSAPPDEMKAVMAATGAHVIVTDRDHAPQVESLVHDDEEPLSDPTSVDATTVDPDTTHLLYPRMVADGKLLAVPISYANWNAQIDINLDLYRTGCYGPPLSGDDVAVTAQQLMHGTGPIVSFPFLLAGLPQVVLPRFEATAFLDAADRFRATTSFFVPAMITRVVDALDPERQLSLRRLLYGGAPFPLDEMIPAIRRLGPVLVQLYGRFEGGWPLTVLGTDAHTAIADGDETLAKSCGSPIPGIELEVRDIDGSPRGELRVRGPSVVTDYADPDGWCALGDLVTTDADGRFYLHGRLDGMINTGSYHVYPAEVETAIAALAGVQDVLVRGEPDPVWGEAVTAYVISDEPPTKPENLKAQLRHRLAPYKIPKTINLVSRLPA